MTADLTPAQAARLEAIEAAPYAEEAAAERVARALFAAEIDGDVTEMDWRAGLDDEDRAGFRRLALAAIDVMRGAADDGAIGRVLGLADEWERRGAVRDFGLSLTEAANRIRTEVRE